MLDHLKSRSYSNKILLYIIVFIGGFLLMNIGLFDTTGFLRTLHLEEFLIIFGVFLLILFAFAHINHKHNRYKTNYLLVAGLLLLTIMSFFVLVLSPETYEICYQGTIKNVTFSFENKTYFLIGSFLSYFFFYLFIYVIPRSFYYRKQFKWIIYLFLLFLVAGLIYSYVVEFNNYLNFFTNLSSGDIYSATVMSFFGHRNVYGLVLFLGIISLIYLHYLDKKFYWYILITFLCLNMVFTMSKTPILLTAFVIVCYLLMRFFFSYQKHKKRNLITFAIFFILIAVVLTLVIVGGYIQIPYISKVSNALKDIFYSGSNTFNSRLDIWINTFDLFTSHLLNMMFGFGFGVFDHLLYAYQGIIPGAELTSNIHNGYLMLVSQGGIVLFVAFILVIIYLVYVIIKMFKIDKDLSLMSLFFLIASLGYMMMESRAIIFTNSPDMIYLSLIATSPLLAAYYHYNHPLINEEIRYSGKEFLKQKSAITFQEEFSLAKFLMYLLTPFVGTYYGFIYHLSETFGYSESLLYSIGGILIFIYLFLPFISQILYDFSKKKRVNYLNYPRKVLLFYLIVVALDAAAVFLIIYFATNINPIYLIVFAIASPIYFYTILYVVRYLRKFTGTSEFINYFNYLCLSSLNKNISLDDYAHKNNRCLKYDPHKKYLLLIASDDLYRVNLEKELHNRGYEVIVYDELLNNFLHKINSRLPYRQNLEASRIYLDDILFDNLFIRFTYVIVSSGRGLTVNMVKDLKEYHQEAKFIFYNPYLISQYYYSSVLYRLFDQAYTLYAADAFTYQMKLIKSYYFNEVLSYREIPITDDFLIVAHANNLSSLKKTADVFYSQYPRGNIVIHLPLKKHDKFFKKARRILGKYYDKVTFVNSFFTEDLILKIAKAKYYVDLVSKDSLSNIDLKNILILKKKIVTNNRIAKLVDNYSPNDIYIFLKDEMLNLEDIFFNNNIYDDFSEEIIHDSNIKNFVDDLLSE